MGWGLLVCGVGVVAGGGRARKRGERGAERPLPPKTNDKNKDGRVHVTGGGWVGEKTQTTVLNFV